MGGAEQVGEVEREGGAVRERVVQALPLEGDLEGGLDRSAISRSNSLIILSNYGLHNSTDLIPNIVKLKFNFIKFFINKLGKIVKFR